MSLTPGALCCLLLCFRVSMIILFRSLENVSSFTSMESGKVRPELKMEAVVISFWP